MIKGNFNQNQISDRIEAILLSGKEMNIYSPIQARATIGSRFRVVLTGVNDEMSDVEVGEMFLTNHICVHTENYDSKFDSLCLMIDKLYAGVANQTELDNLDSVANHDVILSGHVYQQVLVEKLFDCLHINLRARLNRELKKPNFDSLKFRDVMNTKKLIEAAGMIDKRMEHFLATGNLISRTNLDLMQTTGFAIIADKLNATRYLSHFRSIHRGQYFAKQSKTVSVRKLLPEAWGFLCPVHTPDGAPCGLLNHISQSCIPVGFEESEIDIEEFKRILGELGMHSINSDLSLNYKTGYYPVTLDGVHLGYVDYDVGETFVNSLRYLKCKQVEGYNVPKTLELAFIPASGYERNLQWPGIFMSTTPARFLRPVKNLKHDCIEWIGPLEQMNLSIA